MKRTIRNNHHYAPGTLVYNEGQDFLGHVREYKRGKFIVRSAIHFCTFTDNSDLNWVPVNEYYLRQVIFSKWNRDFSKRMESAIKLFS